MAEDLLPVDGQKIHFGFSWHNAGLWEYSGQVPPAPCRAAINRRRRVNPR